MEPNFYAHYGPGVDVISDKHYYDGYLLGIKATGPKGWQTCHIHVPIVLKFCSLHLLEPRGPDQACIRIPLFLKKCYYVELVTRIFQRKERTDIFFQNSTWLTRGMKIKRRENFLVFVCQKSLSLYWHFSKRISRKYRVLWYIVHYPPAYKGHCNSFTFMIVALKA